MVYYWHHQAHPFKHEQTAGKRVVNLNSVILRFAKREGSLQLHQCVFAIRVENSQIVTVAFEIRVGNSLLRDRVCVKHVGNRWDKAFVGVG